MSEGKNEWYQQQTNLESRQFTLLQQLPVLEKGLLAKEWKTNIYAGVEINVDSNFVKVNK